MANRRNREAADGYTSSVPSLTFTAWPPMRAPASVPPLTSSSRRIATAGPSRRPARSYSGCRPSEGWSNCMIAPAKEATAEPVAGSSGVPDGRRTCAHGRRCRVRSSRGSRRRPPATALPPARQLHPGARVEVCPPRDIEPGDRHQDIRHAAGILGDDVVLEADLVRPQAQRGRDRRRIGRERHLFRQPRQVEFGEHAASSLDTAQRTGPTFSSSTKIDGTSSPAASVMAMAEPTVGWPAKGSSRMA